MGALQAAEFCIIGIPPLFSTSIWLHNKINPRCCRYGHAKYGACRPSLQSQSSKSGYMIHQHLGADIFEHAEWGISSLVG